jgi:retron-type reverse transcriptase
MDLSLKNIYKSWYDFRRSKKISWEINNFEYYLEENLFELWRDLNNEKYQCGKYKNFIVNDNKKRRIFVSSVRDRVVHRLIYNYLVDIYDKTFIFDIWSNRKNKGLTKAIFRSRFLLSRYKNNFVWRADIKKFFDNIDHKIILSIISLKIKNPKVLRIVAEIIGSYRTDDNKGLPIGNLTSQIFSNIYLNEFDRFVKHFLKPLAYLRYGDDFIIIGKKEKIIKNRRESIIFLREKLKLEINNKSDILIKAVEGINFLGVKIFQDRINLSNRNLNRSLNKINLQNLSSYRGLVKSFSTKDKINYFDYNVLAKIDLN